MTRLNHQTIVTLDFEASGLDEGSYPIEVGVVFSEGGFVTRSYETLIRPRASWLLSGRWSKAAERIHGIEMAQLADGRDPDDVCANLDSLLAGHVVYADGGDFDVYWLDRLYEGKTPLFSLCRDSDLPGRDLRALRVDDVPAHRALVDAAWLNRALQVIWSAGT